MVSLAVAKEVKLVDISKATKIKVGFRPNSSGAKTKSLFDAPIKPLVISRDRLFNKL